MKFYIELTISAILLLLVFDKPAYVTEMSNTMIGKTVLVVAVACVAKYRGLGAGLMAALIMLILLHDGREGLEGEGGNKLKGALNRIEGEVNDAVSVVKKKEDKTTNEAFTTISDVRMTEGMMNMNSYSEGMASSKFSDGFTGNRPMFNGLI